MGKLFSRSGQIKVGVAISYINTLLTIVISLIFVPFLLKSLGISQTGLYETATALTGQLGVLNFGFGSALIRYVSKYRAENDKESESSFLGFSIIFYSIIAIIILLIGGYICLNVSWLDSNKNLKPEEIAQLPRLIGVMVVWLAICMPANILTGIISAYERFAFLKMQNLVMLIIRTVIVVAVVLMWKTALAIIFVDLILSLITIGINIIFIKRNIDIKVQFKRLESQFLLEIFSYTFFIFLNEIVSRVNWSLDKVILLKISSTTAVTMYSNVMRINNMYMVMSTAISDLTLPKATQMMTNKCTGKELTNLMIKVGRFQLIILCYVFIIFAFFGKEFIGMWIGDCYLDSNNATQTIWLTEMILMVPFSFVLFQNTGISILQAYQKHKFRSVILLFVSIFNVFLTVFLVKRIGIIGAAIGTGTSLLIGNVLIINIYYQIKLNINIWRFYKETLLSFSFLFISIGAIAYFLKYIPGYSWKMLILRCALLLVIYGFIVWFAVLQKDEKNQVYQIFINRNQREIK